MSGSAAYLCASARRIGRSTLSLPSFFQLIHSTANLIGEAALTP
jgi:hypothetical protein